MNDNSSYTRQAHVGFSLLRFAKPIEGEFRAHYLASNIGNVRVAAALGLTMIGLSMLFDSRLLADASFKSAAVLKLVLSLPLLLLLLSTYPGVLLRHARALTYASAGGLCLAAAALPVLVEGPAAQYSFAAPVVTIFVYLMLGLRLVPALVFALPLATVLMWQQAQGAGSVASVTYGGFFLVFTNVIGAFSCYRLEFAARSAFLERQIVSILGGSDSKTGIPNRRYFNSHLQRVWRLAQREKRSLAVVLVELDQFEAFKSHDEQASENMLRRVAQTVMKSARRPLDFAARFSEAEIALVLFDPDKDHLQHILKTMREQVALLDIGHPARPESKYLRVSIGATWSDNDADHDCQVLLDSADRALQEAKGLDGHGMAVLPASAVRSDSQVMQGPWTSTSQD